MLVNLAGIYGRNGDLPRSLDVLERLAVLEPSNPRIARDLTQLRSASRTSTRPRREASPGPQGAGACEARAGIVNAERSGADN